MSQAISFIKEKFFSKKEKTHHDLKVRYDDFVKLLAENDFALELISELQNRYYGKSIFTIPYLRNITKNLLISVQNVVRLLNRLTDNGFEPLEQTYRRIEEEIREVLTGVKEPIFTPTAVSLKEAYREMADKIGDKMANLGEIKNRLHLPVPDGFATTVCVYSQFIEYNHLDFPISQILDGLDIEDTETLMKAEEDIKKIIRKAKLPPELSFYLQKGYEKLSQKAPHCFVSFRSSALGEDAESSFAGQYSSLLNVPPDGLENAYKEVVASKYNARAIYYRRKRGYRDEDIAMSVGVLRMVNAVSSGVLFTEDPNDPDSHRITISAVWGLGQLLVEGQVAPDTYVLDKEKTFELIDQNISTKRVMLLPNPHGGLVKARVPDEKRDRPCLEKFHLQKLLSCARILENHYQRPQDIEWAIDEKGVLYILQSRPLSIIETKRAASNQNFSKYKVALKGGQSACGGIASGPVFRYRTLHDLSVCPRGAVLVAARTSPDFVKIMDKVSAIVTNVGSLTDHMASLAREFQIPTVVNTKKATKRLREGERVLVDATNAIVYSGIGEKSFQVKVEGKNPATNIKATEAYRILKKLVNLIVTLNLLDPTATNFSPEGCRSLHDIVRFAHETSMNTMFEMGRWGCFSGKSRAFRMKSRIPLLIYLIDIEGDLIKQAEKGRVEPEHVHSELFQSLWAGLSHQGLRWEGLSPGQLDLKGFFSAMSQTMVDSIASDQAMGDNYFILARHYLNASLRFGYHFSTVDAYICPHVRDNYISMTFKGGAAPEERRSRRVQFISAILKHLDFEINVKGDLIRARIKYGEPEECYKKLDLLGRLLGCTRLLDMALTQDALVDQCVSHFLKEDYSLGLF